MLALVLIVAAARLPAQTVYLRQSLAVLRLWFDPEAQRRALFQDFPYDLLRQADSRLPPGAAVLLVTSGQDVRHGEYTAFHRALYYLAPRPVWWLAPAPPDGSWESRWWISAPLTPDSVRAVAAEKRAAYVLAVGLAEPLAIGAPLAESADGSLLQLEPGDVPAAGRAMPPEDAGPFWPLRLSGGLAVLFALGYAALATLRRLGFQPHPVEAVALAWIVGSGLASLSMFWLDLLGLPLRWQVATITTLSVAALIWLRAKPFSRDLLITNYQLRITHYVLRFTLYALLSLQLALVVLLAVGRPLVVWDSWANWGVKARTIFLENGITAMGIADPSRAVTHPDYPLMMPLLEAWVYSWLSAPDDRFAGVVAVLSYLATAAIVTSGARRFGASPGVALAAGVATAAIPQFALPAGFAFADVPLAALATAAAIYFAEWLAAGSTASLAVASLAAGMMPWAKREGWVLLAALGLAALLAGRASSRAWKGVGVAAAAAAALSGPWWVFASRLDGVSMDFLPVSLGTFIANSDRLPVIARLALANLAGVDWLFLWPVVALLGVGLLLSRSGGGWRPLDLWPAMAFLYLGALGLAFAFSNYAPYQQHVLSSWPRLAAQVAPLLVAWLAARFSRGEQA